MVKLEESETIKSLQSEIAVLKRTVQSGQIPIRDAVEYAKQMANYFRRRDEMNAEVHNDQATSSRPQVRYSPITKHAEAVFWLLKSLDT